MKTSDKINKIFESDKERIRRRNEDKDVGKIVSAQDGKDIVKESNRLVCSCYTLAEVEQKMMYCFLRHVQRDSNIRRYTIPASDIQSICNFDKSKFHTEIEVAADKLLSRVVTLYSDDKDAWIKTHWLSFIKYADGNITFEFNPYLKGDLLEMQNKFTIFDVRLPMRLSGVYSARLYLLLKRLESLNKKLHIIMVDELRNIFELKPSMSPVGKIRQKILDPALQQINNSTDMLVSYEPIKSGRSIVSFRFFIKENKKNLRKKQTECDNLGPEANLFDVAAEESQQSETAAEPASEHEELFEIVKEYGLNKNLFLDTIQNVMNPEDAVEFSIETYKKDVKKGKKISNPASYILGIIRHYDPQAAAIAKNHVQAVDGMSAEDKAGYEEICLNIKNYGSLDGEKWKNTRHKENLTDEELTAMSDEEVLAHYNHLTKIDQQMFKFSLKSRFYERFARIFG